MNNSPRREPLNGKVVFLFDYHSGIFSSYIPSYLYQVPSTEGTQSHKSDPHSRHLFPSSQGVTPTYEEQSQNLSLRSTHRCYKWTQNKNNGTTTCTHSMAQSVLYSGVTYSLKVNSLWISLRPRQGGELDQSQALQYPKDKLEECFWESTTISRDYHLKENSSS